MTRKFLEIGSRHGGFIEDLARRNPDAECYGIEYRYIWTKGAREKAFRRGLSNIRYFCGDARIVVRRFFRAGELEAAFVFFPDPWPKARHEKRRLLQSSFLQDLGQLLVPGAPLYILTDVREYAEFIREQAAAAENLEPLPEEAWPNEETDWGPTRRERVPHLLQDDVERIFLRRRT